MLNECLNISFKNWIIQEPKHTEKIKVMITEVIEKKKRLDVTEMDKLLNEEYAERLFRNHEINNDIAKKLKIIRSPSLIINLSNELEHEIKSRLLKYFRMEDQQKKISIKDKITQKILKIKTSIEYINNYKDKDDNDINKMNNNINDQIIDYTIKEIKIKQKWVEIKEKWKESVEAFVDDLILTNKGKNQDELNTSSVYTLVNKLREKIASTKNEITKELEIAYRNR